MNIIIAWTILVITLIFAGLLPGTDLVVWSFALLLAGLFINLHPTWSWMLALLPSAIWFFIIARRCVSSVIHLARQPDLTDKLLAVPRAILYAVLIGDSAYFAGGVILIFSGLAGAWRGAAMWQDALGGSLVVFNWAMEVLFDHHRHAAITTFYKLLSSPAPDTSLTVATIAAVAGGWAGMAWPKQFGRQHLLVARMKRVMDLPKSKDDEHLRGGWRT